MEIPQLQAVPSRYGPAHGGTEGAHCGSRKRDGDPVSGTRKQEIKNHGQFLNRITVAGRSRDALRDLFAERHWFSDRRKRDGFCRIQGTSWCLFVAPVFWQWQSFTSMIFGSLSMRQEPIRSITS